MLRCGLLLLVCCGWMQAASAWTTPWAPKFKATSVDVTPFSKETIGAFLSLINTPLVEQDLKTIASQTKITTRKYVPAQRVLDTL